MRVMNKLRGYIALTRLNRPVGIYLVLWPTLWGLWLASDGVPEPQLLIVFILGAILMRSAGCVINDYADCGFDGKVKRTCQRPLVTGVVTKTEALGVFVVLCVLALLLVLTLNTLTLVLSLGALFFAMLYPFMKRYTYWPQAFLGIAFAWAVPMGFAAVLNDVPWQAWVVFMVTLVWSLIYDTAYAVGDMKDDLKVGVKSTAILFSPYLWQWVAFFQCIMLGLLLWIGQLFELGASYYLSLFLVCLWFIFDLKRLASQDAAQAFQVFLHNHWVGLIVLVGMIIDLSR